MRAKIKGGYWLTTTVTSYDSIIFKTRVDGLDESKVASLLYELRAKGVRIPERVPDRKT